ncbi:hypothetical protein [Ureibacillus endophyticus]|uniref:Tryptophan-rich sensory protein n=1 Tax=Ureibacillus endophyticus TaxID=1978490 RepID=A0A494Z9S7_9BACL|nr:hypothetical protein [Lysinibacillus endophyticus]RKQ19385.1 hypothetical protein D8M03_03230 [Lysinibacillus endophyticus]
MTRLFIILFSLTITMYFTLQAYLLKFNGKSTIDIINRLPLLFAPANYVYYLWLIVFIFLFLWANKYWSLRNTEKSITNLQTIFISCVMLLQISNLICWHYEYFLQSLILFFIQLLLMFALYLTYPLKNEMLRIRIPVAIYFGWSTYLFILQFCYILVYYGWEGFGLSNALWAVIVMTVGTAIALHLRYHYYDIIFPIIFIWCYIGIVIANGFDELLVSTAALFLSGVMIAGIFFMKKNPAR